MKKKLKEKKNREERAKLDELLAKELWDREKEEEETRKKKRKSGRIRLL